MHIKHTLLGQKKSGLSFFLSVLNFYARIDIDIEFEIKIKTNIDNILSINIKNKLVLAVATDIINMREVLFLQTIYLKQVLKIKI